MRLSEITIKNFCSCENVLAHLGDFNPIVGYNNSGKSNILRAVNWLLKKSVLPSHMFFDSDAPVIVEGVIEDVNIELLPINQQKAISPYINEKSLKFRRRQNAPGCSAGQLKIDVFDSQNNVWVDNPAGLDNAIAVLFPEPLYIEAMENVGEDVGKFGAKNTIGLLLKYVLGRINSNNAAAVATMKTALSQVSDHLNGANRMTELTDFEADATNAISSFFPGLSLHLNFAPLEIEDLFKSSTVTLSDLPGFPRPFSSFGHGAQRSAHMALIKLLADLNFATGNSGGTVVLLIDEPELYLHPQAIEILRESLLKLSSQNFQIIFSTHSPLLIGRVHALQTLMIYKNAVNKTVVRNKLASASVAFASHMHHAEAVFSIQSASYLLFSEKVLLVEGKTEQMLIPQIYQTIKGNSYARDKGCIVSGSSSAALVPLMKILESVGFSPRALTDLDFIFRIAPNAGLIDANHVSFLACKNWFLMNSASLGIFLDANGLPTKAAANGDKSAYSAAESFELMAKAMQTEVKELADILRQRNIWVWHGGAIEAHIGIGKNDADRIGFLNCATETGKLDHAKSPQDLHDLAHWM